MVSSRNEFSALFVAAFLFHADTCPAQETESDSVIESNSTVLGQKPPGPEPELFAPDVIRDGVHSAPTFTRDCREMYWSAYYVPEGKRARTQHIFRSRMIDGHWSVPELAPFSGVYSDGGPFITHDGSQLYFYSNRPNEPGKAPTDEFISDIWVMDRQGDSWGEPRRLSFNSDAHDGMQSVADDGNIYFQSNRPGSHGIFDIYCSRLEEGQYSAPANLGRTVNCPGLNFSPFIAPDESYLILAYNNNAPNNGLHISFRKPDGLWTKPVNLGSAINTTSAQRFPGLSPGSRYLFFTRDEGKVRGLYWVDAGVIERLREHVLSE